MDIFLWNKDVIYGKAAKFEESCTFAVNLRS